jgi:hypothetical protein
MSLNSLPSETLFNILLNLSLEDIQEKCRVNTQFNIICNDEVFWKEYLRIHYGVTNKNINFTSYRRTVTECDEIVNFCLNKECYISCKLLNLAISILTHENIIDDIDYYQDQNLIYSLDSLDKQNIYVSPTEEITFPSDILKSTSIRNIIPLTKKELQVAREYLKYISILDYYIFPSAKPNPNFAYSSREVKKIVNLP